ncbi:hypothetical protein Patl1_25609 [Pistacia atlantica]|uniref:Uncharacterized protein n=1 Tax=Pistacia atlantica TaxID=434234 RepID=A0ACC1AZM5_9ROSI|nr:hypothetical protein Patl1_25609 [Pistacia atlantica]
MYGDEVWCDGASFDDYLSLTATKIDVLIPKPLESNVVLDVQQIACGVRHVALVTRQGEVSTWGEESGGRLGHGIERDFSRPRLVDFLALNKVDFVACGEHHSCAVSISGDLFTWGDGTHNVGLLGHGTDVSHWIPKRVCGPLEGLQVLSIAYGTWHTALATASGKLFTFGDGSFAIVELTGHSALTTSGNVFIMGSTACEISCGAHHVAVLTWRSEVLTWGRGANGRLGHGDTDDRKTPTWVSGADQSVCSGCRQAFGFTRKRHNCYNCGLVHCHACSSKKALRAALAPTPGKPHRVCDACYAKLKAAEAGNTSNISRKITAPRRSVDGRERIERGEQLRSSRVLFSPSTEAVKYLEIKSGKPGARTDSSIVRASQVPSHTQLKDVAFPSTLSGLNNGWWPMVISPTSVVSPPPQQATMQQPGVNSRPASPYSRRPSPPRAGFSRSVIERLKKSNEVLTQDVSKLLSQIKSLKRMCDTQDVEIKKLHKNAHDATIFATGETSKFRSAKELVSSISDQLKEMMDNLPADVNHKESLKAICAQANAFVEANPTSEISSHLPSNADYDHHNTPDGNPSESATSSMLGNHTVDRVDVSHYAGREVVPHKSRPSGTPGEREIKEDSNSQQAEEWWSRNKDRVLKEVQSVRAVMQLLQLHHPLIQHPRVWCPLIQRLPRIQKCITIFFSTLSLQFSLLLSNIGSCLAFAEEFSLETNGMGQQQSKDELLYQQVNYGNVEGIKALARDGAGLEWIDKECKTPLIAACMNPELYNVAKTLIELGANVNAYRPGRHGGTPLHHAVKRGLESTVKLLLSNGANALLMNDDCQTPLEVARGKGYINVVRAIESHICLFSGWLREFYGPGFLEILVPQLLSRNVWVVIYPTGSRNPTKPFRLELAIYPSLQVLQS